MKGIGRGIGAVSLAVVATLSVALPGLAPARGVRHETRASLRAAIRLVESDASHDVHLSRRAQVVATVSHTVYAWAYGYVFIPGSRKDEGAAPPAAFIARRRGRRWSPALQGTASFTRLLTDSPTGLLPAAERKADLASTDQPGSKLGGSGPSAPDFALPWATGQTWYLVFGAHNTGSDFGPHPYTSLDFSGGDGIARAAAAGVAYRPCANLVVIDHGGGWETGYYHLIDIRVRDGQRVRQGTPLGHTSRQYNCGGIAYSSHVHFSIYHFSQAHVHNAFDVFHLPTPDINGMIIGGWAVHDGATDGLGYLQRISDGKRVYSVKAGGSGAIPNNGTVGAGGKGYVPTSGYETLAALNVYATPSSSGQVVGSLGNGAAIDIGCQTRGSSVNGSSIWDRLSGGGYIPDYYVDTQDVGTFSPGIPQCSASTTTTMTTGNTTTTTTRTTSSTTTAGALNRYAIASYDRIAPNAPYHGYFDNAWQNFTASSNTITLIGAVAGNPKLTAGATTSSHMLIKLCSSQPDANGSCTGQLAAASPAIVNYGTTEADIGDVAVTPGRTYWIVWYQPAAVSGTTWVTYWWAGGSSISQSTQMEALVKGYNR